MTKFKQLLQKLFKSKAHVILFTGIFFFFLTIAVSAISYGGGNYVNLCGSSDASFYSCPGSCNPYSGTCSANGAGGGWYVFKYTCNGDSGSSCVGDGSFPNNGEEKFGPGSTVNISTDSFGACNRTVQLDVFNRDCRPGGNVHTDPWVCSGSDLVGFMVWRYNNCPPPPTQYDLSGRVYCQEDGRNLSGVGVDVFGDGRSSDYTNSNGIWNQNDYNSGQNINSVEITDEGAAAAYNGPFCTGSTSLCTCSNGRYINCGNVTANHSNLNFYYTSCTTPTPVPNNPPNCTALNLSTNTVTAGQNVTISGNINDSDGSVNQVALYWAPTTSNYCSAGWNFIANANVSGGTYSYNWNTSGVTHNGNIMVAANVRDDDGAWCTGNPGATSGNNACGSGFGVCTNCSRTLTVNQLQNPTVSGSIVSNQSCGASSNISGILNNGINNPLSVSTTHGDGNGLANISNIRVVASPGNVATFPGTSTQIGDKAFARLDRATNGTYTIFAYGNNNQIVNNVARADLVHYRIYTVSSPNNSQVVRDTRVNSSHPAGAKSWVQPVFSSENFANNTISFEWQVGFINASNFNGNITVGATTQDREASYPTNAATGYRNIGNWAVDLTLPVIDPVLDANNPVLASGDTIEVTFDARDNQSGIQSIDKRCGITGISSGGLKEVRWADDPLDRFPFITLDSSDNDRINSYGYNPNGAYACFNQVAAPSAANSPLNLQLVTNTGGGEMVFRTQARDNACNTSTVNQATLELATPWLMTTQGDTFSEDYQVEPHSPIENTDLEEEGQQAYLSTYTYLERAQGIPAGFSSERRVSVGNYNDLNDGPRLPNVSSSWFNYLAGRAEENADHFAELTSGSIAAGRDMQAVLADSTLFGSVNANDVYVIRRNGNLNLQGNITCNAKVVFVVTGNLTITPDLTIPANEYDKGCLFFVGGRTTVTPGNDRNSSDSQTNYDRIDSFIITRHFTSQADGELDGLLVDGGLILDTNGVGTHNFNRDIGSTQSGSAPSEIIRYDGVRYIYLFEDILTYNQEYSLREKQFINNLILENE